MNVLVPRFMVDPHKRFSQFSRKKEGEISFYRRGQRGVGEEMYDRMPQGGDKFKLSVND